jgi:hypothetical protein
MSNQMAKSHEELVEENYQLRLKIIDYTKKVDKLESDILLLTVANEILRNMFDEVLNSDKALKEYREIKEQQEGENPT